MKNVLKKIKKYNKIMKKLFVDVLNNNNNSIFFITMNNSKQMLNIKKMTIFIHSEINQKFD